MKIGRPTLLTSEMADAICDRLIEGESLSSICRDEAMPAKSAVFRWIATDPSFKGPIHAREDRGLHCCGRRFYYHRGRCQKRLDGIARPHNPGWKANGEHIQRSRLRVETRKWMLSKLLPHLYGDKSSVELNGQLNIAEAILAARKRVTRKPAGD